MEYKNQPVYFGQLIFFEATERSEKNRAVMARVALHVAGEGAGFPLSFGDIVAGLGWEDYHSVLALLALHPNVATRWTDWQLAKLKEWA